MISRLIIAAAIALFFSPAALIVARNIRSIQRKRRSSQRKARNTQRKVAPR